MLRVIGHIPPPPASVLVMEGSVPIQFRVPGPALYTWRDTFRPNDGPAQLLTVGIDSDSAGIRSVVVAKAGYMYADLAAKPPVVPSLPVIDVTPAYFGAPHVPGLPLVDVREFELFRGRVAAPELVEPQSFYMMGNGRSVFIALNIAVKPEICYRCDRAGFFVKSGFLCGFGFFDLTDPEYAALENVGSLDEIRRLEKDEH